MKIKLTRLGNISKVCEAAPTIHPISTDRFTGVKRPLSSYKSAVPATPQLSPTPTNRFADFTPTPHGSDVRAAPITHKMTRQIPHMAPLTPKIKPFVKRTSPTDPTDPTRIPVDYGPYVAKFDPTNIYHDWHALKYKSPTDTKKGYYSPFKRLLAGPSERLITGGSTAAAAIPWGKTAGVRIPSPVTKVFQPQSKKHNIEDYGKPWASKINPYTKKTYANIRDTSPTSSMVNVPHSGPTMIPANRSYSGHTLSTPKMPTKFAGATKSLTMPRK